MSQIIFGIDYSMTCPAMCMLNPESPKFSDCAVFFLTKVKSHARQWGDNIYGTLTPDHQSEVERYYNLGNTFLKTILLVRENGYEPVVFIEGYSMHSQGRVFAIAENQGFLKCMLWANNIPFYSVAPTTIKKYATGMGNADKNMMYAAFLGEGNPALDEEIFPDRKPGPVKSPVTDIVDGYFIAKWGFHHGLRTAAIANTSATTGTTNQVESTEAESGEAGTEVPQAEV